MAYEVLRQTLGTALGSRLQERTALGREGLITRKLENKMMAKQIDEMLPMQIDKMKKEIEWMLSPMEEKEMKINAARTLSDIQEARELSVAEIKHGYGMAEIGERGKWQKEIAGTPRTSVSVGAGANAGQPFRFTKEGTDLTLKYQAIAEKYTKDLEIVRGNLANIQSSVARLQSFPADEKNRIAVSQAIITSFNKITDPTSVVRESEYKRTEQGAALFNRFKAFFIKIEQGGVLTDDDLIEVGEASAGLEALRRQIINEKLEKQIRQPAAKRGLDPDEIAPLYGDLPKSSTTQQTTPDVVTTPDGDISRDVVREHWQSIVGKE